MKHLLDIKYFLTEALPTQYQSKYHPIFKDRTTEVTNRLNKLLDNKERVYIPYSSETISETQDDVRVYLFDRGYKIVDYKLNSAFQIGNPKRVMRISKLLTEDPELLKRFTLDDTRANSRAQKDFSIVLSSNYEDIASMSYCRDWNSCMDIESGGNKQFVANDIKQGTIVAYLIKNDDLEIDNPVGRVNIKPYYSSRDESEVLYVPDLEIYGNVPDEKGFIEKIKDYLKEKQEVKLVGFYFKMGGLYSDNGSPIKLTIDKEFNLCYDCELDSEGYDRLGFNQEGFNRLGFNRFGYGRDGYSQDGYNEQWLDRNGNTPYHEHIDLNTFLLIRQWVDGTFTLDEKGFVNVEGDVNIRYMMINKLPCKFGIVTGVFQCSNNGLTTLEGVPVEVLGKTRLAQSSNFIFTSNENRLKNLDGMSKVVNGGISMVGNEITSLVGLPEVINYGLLFNNNQLTNLYGLKTIKELDIVNFEDNRLVSVNGLPEKLKYCFLSNNNLTILEGSTLKEAMELDLRGNLLEKLVGLPNLTWSIDVSDQKNGKVFTQEEIWEISDVPYCYV